eukprot:TRINITY_DN112_c0_g2_i1.p1 TRINITY_DN112_c0_g2~~TRINITY_DN112_c0_g2_i1.p1  ORF type:complete len:116 (-),score=26.57 TRINITY_DN112_c0_g2_i1:98-445(-)
MRGFAHGSLGPKDSGDYVGGDIYSSAGLSLYFDLPHRLLQQLGVRGHFFANAGNLTRFSDFGVRSFLASMRCTAGVGLVAPSPFGRLELHLSHNFREISTDKTEGFQFGVGLDFL